MNVSGPTPDRPSDYARVNVNSPQRRTRSVEGGSGKGLARYEP